MNLRIEQDGRLAEELALKEAILSYARRFQAGALFGSLEQHNNNSSSDTWVEGTARGKEIGRRVSVGYAESYGLTETSPVITTTSAQALRPGSAWPAAGPPGCRRSVWRPG